MKQAKIKAAKTPFIQGGSLETDLQMYRHDEPVSAWLVALC